MSRPPKISPRAPGDTENVLNYGVDYGQTRYSPLDQINKETVKYLVPVWNYSLTEHPDSELSSSSYYHSLGHNVGFLALASDAALIADVDAALGAMLEEPESQSLASAAGLTDLPPREPDVLPMISPVQLRGDRAAGGRWSGRRSARSARRPPSRRATRHVVPFVLNQGE